MAAKPCLRESAGKVRNDLLILEYPRGGHQTNDPAANILRHLLNPMSAGIPCRDSPGKMRAHHARQLGGFAISAWNIAVHLGNAPSISSPVEIKSHHTNGRWSDSH